MRKLERELRREFWFAEVEVSGISDAATSSADAAESASVRATDAIAETITDVISDAADSMAAAITNAAEEGAG
jgi:hypothetical protein